MHLFCCLGRKNRDKGQPDIYIYFWDNRDGNEFMGWYFGEDVGASDVAGLAEMIESFDLAHMCK